MTDTPSDATTILVVDDDPAVRQFSADALSHLGYNVHMADGAVSALRTIDSHPDIALLFTDVVMPQTNGRALAQAAQILRPNLRVLFTSGYSGDVLVQNGVGEPGIDLIAKPFTIDQLDTRVRRALSR